MQTASQILAAKRAAKQAAAVKRQAKAQIGNRRGDRNRKSIDETGQRLFRREMRDGEPMTLDDQLTEAIRARWLLKDLVYGQDTDEALYFFERLIRGLRCVAAVYNDRELNTVCNQAQAAHERIYAGGLQTAYQDASPNQRRIMLEPLARLADYHEAYNRILPAAAQHDISGYITSVQIALYTTALYENHSSLDIAILNKVIKGESINALAKAAGRKVNQIREAVLNAAWDLWHIADCFTPLPIPRSIPDLRSGKWQPFADPEHLRDRIREVVEKWLIPFESFTGISLINYKHFRERLITIETAHKEAA